MLRRRGGGGNSQRKQNAQPPKAEKTTRLEPNLPKNNMEQIIIMKAIALTVLIGTALGFGLALAVTLLRHWGYL